VNNKIKHEKIIFSTILSMLINLAMAQKNYELTVDGKTIELALNEDIELMINNSVVKMKLKEKNEFVFEDAMLKFNYPKGFTVSHLDIEKGITQKTIINASGSGVLVQTYTNMSPKGLADLFFEEITKEDINYGYKAKKENREIKLKSGETVLIEKRTLTYKDDINIYEIAILPGKDEGILVVAMKMDDEKNTEGEKMIARFWETLSAKFKITK
jgi:hypothetical protein